jgi:N-acetylneuraminic acid mutarotase
MRRTLWRAHAAIATGMVTLAGMAVLAAAPAQAGTAAPAQAGTAAKAPPAGMKAYAASTQKPSSAHYTNAPCNSASPRRDYARCMSVVYTATDHKIVATPDQPPPGALGPADIQGAYKLPSTGQGQTVAIVDAFGDSSAESDLATFRSFYGLPPCTTANGCFQKADQNGGTNYPPDDTGWALETSLDLDAVSAACPNCHILLVEGNDNSLTSLGIAENTAVSMGAKFVSNSYGVPGEDPSELNFDQYYTHPGVAIVASTGDTGNLTNWPATNPGVTGAGGTTLTKDTSVPRGWTETAWDSGGSGCSPFEPRPSYQNNINTDCPNNKAIADLSADADPNTGLAVFDTNGQGGWLQVGGTSLSSPLLTAMYALAGTPATGTFPVSYAYNDPTQSSDIFDVTQGSNGGCGNVLCNAGPGWDGPTGLGTPDGVAALTSGPQGVIAGKVTNSSGSAPIAGASVSATGGYSAVTDSSGDYTMTLPVGSYSVTAQAFGFKSVTTTGVTVTQGQTTTENFGLRAVPSRNLSGTITDGSGHAWPLYAKITIDGFPGGAIYTSPYTGHYSVNLPRQNTYALHVTPLYPGYTTRDLSVHLGTVDKVFNAKVTVDSSTCTAPGYAYKYNGALEQFTGWTGTTTQDGWTNVDNLGNGQVWAFDNPGGRTPPPGGDASFAIVDSDHYGPGNSQDTSLVSPVIDLSRQTSPEIGFDTFYNEFPGQTADVDLSVDGGQTWSNVWEQTTTSVTGHVDIPIPQAAGQSNVKVRFHFTGDFGWWWELDNVFIGTRKCAPTPGGLVAGIVSDNNTGNPVNGAKVASSASPGQFGISAPTPDDPNISDGFYWLFATPAVSTQFSATDGNYTPATATVNVTSNFVTQQNWSLKAGHLTITPGSLSATTTLGGAKTGKVTFTNDGTAPVQVQLSEQGGGFTPMTGQKGGPGAPLEQVKGKFTPDAAVLAATPGATPGAKAARGILLRQPTPSDPPWTEIANYPVSIMDNAAGYDTATGKVYSIAGFNGSANIASSYVYDPASQQWSQIADAPQALEAPAGAFINGKMYVAGGWDSNGNATSTVYAYDPSANSWSQVASLPTALTAMATTALHGQLYVVGGCTTGFCSPTSNAVYRYDPGSNAWTQLANYPAPVAFGACAGLSGEVVCAGGTNADNGQTFTATYIYDPGTNTWSQGANMPYDDWAMAYSGSGGMLQVAGGVTSNSTTVTNQAAQYDPSSNSWSALPNANNAEYRGGGSCGLYKVGGSTGGFNPTPFAEVLPGNNQCGAEDVPWLSESTTAFTVSPGQSQAVTVTMDSSAVGQPGGYSAELAINTNDPYQAQPIGVTMQVNPPSTWGKVAGTVTDASTGNPIAGATVQICTMYSTQTGTCGPVTYTLKTDNSGGFQLWLNQGFNPLQLIAAKDGYQPVAKVVKITRGSTTTVTFALAKS